MFKNIGFLVFLFKFSPIALKFFKSVKMIKIALAGGSMVAYSYLFTWEFALILILALVFHEYGHLTAMKKLGMKTKGMFLIPFLGGAAVPDEDFKNRAAETYSALYGPYYGLILCVPFLIYGLLFDSILAIGLVSFMALLNLFNLFPINPLDGGRVTKSIAFSLNSKLGFFVTISGFILASFLIYYLEIWLLLFVLVIGGLELFFEWRQFKSQYNYIDEKRFFEILFEKELSENEKNSFFEDLLGFEDENYKYIDSENTKNIEIERMKLNCMAWYKGLDKNIPPYFYSFLENFNKNTQKLLKTDYEHKKMNKEEIIKYSIYYILLCFSFLFLIYFSSTVEGADLALKLLKEDIS